MQPRPAISPRLRSRPHWAAILLALLAATPGTGVAQDAAVPGPDRSVDFAEDVFPVFRERCHACHGPDQQMGLFRLDARSVALGGGASGPNILPGDAERSPLFQRIAGIGELNAMPMAGDALTTEQVAIVRAWIDQGAEWPVSVGVAEGPVAQHWAYRPMARPAPAAVGDSTIRGPIDSFLLARLESGGLRFSPAASRTTLVRRVSLDLRGLPPSIEEVESFLADSSPDAYERMVDRFLKSPHFGEHWAGYWLDLARYADTNGYESDEPRTVWAYRDWVIDAFNRNLPFDQFTAEQLAGDLLENPTVDQIVATGFHRNTMINSEAGSKDDEFYDAAVKDRVDTTATVWLGSTLGCAQCHDHKYDPFTQTEYYRLYSIFNNTADSAIKASEELEVFKGDADEFRRMEDEVRAVRAVLDTPTPELEAAQRAWEERTLPWLTEFESAWTPLEPVAVSSEAGVEFDVLEDRSARARAPAGGADVYEVELRAAAGPLTGIRLEALPRDDDSVSGPDSADPPALRIDSLVAEAWTPSLLAKSRQQAADAPAWGNWHSIGPFRVRSRDEAFATAFPPESNRDLSAVFEEGHLAWLERKFWADGRIHYFMYIPDDSETNCASYAFRTVEVDEPTTVTVSLGSLKGLKVWLNSEVVLSTDPTRTIAPDQEMLRLDLRPGVNEILLKLTNDSGAYGFYFQPYHGDEREARLEFASATADEQGWTPVDLSVLLDAKVETAWQPGADAESGGGVPVAYLRLAEPRDLVEGSVLRLRLINEPGDKSKGLPGRFRVSATGLDGSRLAALQQSPARARAVLAAAPPRRSDGDAERLAAHYRSIAPELEPERRRHAELRKDLEGYRERHTVSTFVMRELPEPREASVQKRGNFLDLGERVEPGVPSVLSAPDPDPVRTRLDLAKWLTSGTNPLTARVRVNQIWNRVFGRGLVTTHEDFGTQGDPPTHPQLLDWLATEFVRLEWDTQALLRTILLSSAYRQSSAVSALARERDPDNRLLSRGSRYRMTAESVRDIALAASGQLSRAVGGPSVFPPQPPEVFGDHFIEGGFKIWPTSKGADRYRRGLYTFYKRTVVYPPFMNFDAPDRTVCTVDRSSSNTPLQALNTLNDPAFFEAAGSLAHQMLTLRDSNPSGRIVHGFRSVLSRDPSADEAKRLERLLDGLATRYEAEPQLAADLVSRASQDPRVEIGDPRAAPWVMLANVILNLDETFTRE